MNLEINDEWVRNFPRYSDQAARELAAEARAALKRVAAGNATHADAVRLAVALGHHDLFAKPAEPSNATHIEDDAE